MPLAILPPEHVQRIVRQLFPHFKETQSFPQDALAWMELSSAQITRQALVQLFLTCKYLSAIAQSILYHHFGFIETTFQASFSFFRTIHEKPKLGHEVHLLKISMFPIDEHCQRGRSRGCDRLHRRIAGQILPALIVPRTLHFKHFCVKGPINWHVFNRTYRVAANAQTYLMIVNDTSSRGLLQDRVSFPHENDSPADHLKLETFTITSPQMLPMPHSIGIRHLKLLQISDSRLSKGNLNLFIRTPENLREFVYRESTSPRSPSESKDPRCVRPQDVFEYLAARSDSLRRVTVIMNKGPKPLTSAVKLTGLEELCINKFAIFNMERMIHQSSKVDEFGLVDALPLALKALHLEILPRGLVCVDTAIAKYVASTYGH